MKIKSGFILRQIAGSYVAVPVGARTVDFNGMITLNDTAAFLWHQLEQDCDRDALVEAVLAEYEVDEAHARRSVENFLDSLRQAGCLDE